MRNKGRSPEEKEAARDTQGLKDVTTGVRSYTASKVSHIYVMSYICVCYLYTYTMSSHLCMRKPNSLLNIIGPMEQHFPEYVLSLRLKDDRFKRSL